MSNEIDMEREIEQAFPWSAFEHEIGYEPDNDWIWREVIKAYSLGFKDGFSRSHYTNVTVVFSNVQSAREALHKRLKEK
jgi:hypothetical protein